jgi:16S rRNA processing protein RimM
LSEGAHEPDRPLAAGRVGRPHGLDGSFHVTGALPRLLVLGGHVTVAGRELEIVRRAGTEQNPILRLAGVEDRDGAQALRGRELTVAASSAPALAEGEWWAHELEGCRVLDGGRLVGVVSRLLELPSCEALEVAREGGGQALIVPMVKDAIRSVDVKGGEVQVDMAFIGEQEEPKT